MTVRATSRRQLGADALLLIVTLIWGGTFVMVKDAVSAYPVFPFLTLRFGLATLVLLLLSARRLRSLGWKGLLAGMLIGLFLFGGYALQTVGLCYTSASKAGFITGLSVVLVPIFSATLLRRPPSLSAVAGVCLATIGLALLTLSSTLSVSRGDLIVLGCAVAFALHIVSVSAFAPRMDPLALACVQIATAALASGVFGVFGVFGGASWTMPAASTWFAAAFTGVLGTAAAFGIQTAMQRFTTPTHTAVIFTAEPVFAAVFGVLLAGDVLTIRAIVGGVLILIGTLVSEVRWSDRTATLLSRFLGPQYVVTPLLVVLAFCDPMPWQEALLWAAAAGALALIGPLLLLRRELRRGGISDWHLSNRKERLLPVPVFAGLFAVAAPLILLFAFGGPLLLRVAFVDAALLVVLSLLITTLWKISQHVASIAAVTTLITALLGLGATPLLLLIPVVAWARVKIHAHTVAQTVAGGLLGSGVTLATLYFSGVI